MAVQALIKADKNTQSTRLVKNDSPGIYLYIYIHVYIHNT